MGLVHLDIKPDNIFITLPTSSKASTDVNCDYELMINAQYKIGNNHISLVCMNIAVARRYGSCDFS